MNDGQTKSGMQPTATSAVPLVNAGQQSAAINMASPVNYAQPQEANNAVSLVNSEPQPNHFLYNQNNQLFSFEDQKHQIIIIYLQKMI